MLALGFWGTNKINNLLGGLRDEGWIVKLALSVFRGFKNERSICSAKRRE